MEESPSLQLKRQSECSGIISQGKVEEVLTYKRRARTGGQKRTSSVALLSVNLQDGNDVETVWHAGVADRSSYIAGESDLKNWGKSPDFVLGNGAHVGKAWKRLMGPNKIVVPKRIIGQYFLDLGQSDFSYSTCRSCGLFYARGLDHDEKVHNAYHRNRTQGIQFKGWQNERIASRLDNKGNRVIIVLPEDSHRQTKVKEVIDVMEVELGLTPGWLLQRSCKVYLFISSTKKIVGCLMAEPIKYAFRVVPVECKVRGSGESGKLDLHKEHDIQGSTKVSRLSQDFQDTNRNHHGSSVLQLPATRQSEKEGGEDELMKTEQVLLDQKATLVVSPEGTTDPATLFQMDNVNNATRCPAYGKFKAKEDLLPPLCDNVKQGHSSVRDEIKIRKITDFFALKVSHSKKEINCKSEWDVSCLKLQVEDNHSGHDMDVKFDARIHDVGQDVKLVSLQLEQDRKAIGSYTGSLLAPGAIREKPFTSMDDKQEGSYKADKQEGSFKEDKQEGIPKYDKQEGSAKDDKQEESSKDGKQAEISKQGERGAANVMLFGNIKFSRETTPRKRVSQHQVQDLGSAIMCTKTPVPVICGVRVIWVSQSERRKGIASHLLDAMRKSFCLGLVLEPSQFAFSQPTPEGRIFAGRYCKTDHFLVYTTS